MTRRFRSIAPIFALCVLLALSGALPPAWGEQGGRAASAPPRLVVFTETEALDLAVKNSEELKFLEMNVRIAQERVRSAGGVENPEVRFRDISTYYFTDKVDQLQVGLRWNPPRLGELGRDKQEAQVVLFEKRLEVSEFKLAFLRRVRVQAALVETQIEQLSKAETRFDLEDKRLADVVELVKLGRRTVIYLTKARLRHLQSQNELKVLRQTVKSNRRELASLLGLPGEAQVTLDPFTPVGLTLDQLQSYALQNRMEIKLASERQKLTARESRYERLKLVPWFSFIEIGYRYEPDKTDRVELVFGLELPLFNFNLGNIAATDEAVQKRELQQTSTRERIRDEVAEAFALYEEALADEQTFNSESQEMLLTVEKLIEEAKAQGTLLSDEVMELMLTSIEIHQIQIQKRYLLLEAWYTLCEAVGAESPKDLK